MVRLPRYGAAHDLLVYAGVADEPGRAGPLFQIEELAEELKCLLFLKEGESDVHAQMRFENGCRFLQISKQPGVFVRLFLWFRCKWVDKLGLEGQAPMQIDATKIGILVEEGETVVHEGLGNWIGILRLARDTETGDDTHVLIKARSFGQSAQATFDRPDLGLKLLVGQRFLIHSSKREKAAVPTGLHGKD